MSKRGRKKYIPKQETAKVSEEPVDLMSKLTESERFEIFVKAMQALQIKNPNNTSNNKSVRYQTYTRDQIVSFLQSPTANVKNLRNASKYMYSVDNRYKRLIWYYAYLYLFQYVISPLNFDSSKYKKEAFRKQYMKASNVLELMNLAEELGKEFVVALRDGAFYGVRWLDSNSSFIQTLDPDNCEITSVMDGTFLFSYDMSKITNEDQLKNFPPEFTKMYRDYENNGNKFQPVPQDISVCVKADPSVWDYTIPPFSAVLPELYRISNFSDIEETTGELNNYKLLAAQVPLNNEKQPTMTYDEVMKYYGHLSKNIGERVGLAVSPFNIQDFSFEQSAGAADVDSLSRAVKNFWISAGTSSMLHGENNNTSGVLKLAVKGDESFMFGLLKQAEKNINRYLKTAISGTYKFKITFLPTTWYNYDEYIKKYKEALNYGVGVSYYLASLSIPQYDVEGLSKIENDILNVDEVLHPLKTSSQMPAEDSEAGRNETSDEDLTDAGEVTRDNDSNDNV